jgi:cell division protein FtsB
MIRFVNAAAVAALLLVCFGLYNGVHRVKAQEQALVKLKSQLAQEAEAIRVLKAEWSYLNQPERLQALARRHLALAPTGASQITVLASLPLRPPPLSGASPVIEAGDLPERVIHEGLFFDSPLPRPKPAAGERAVQP